MNLLITDYITEEPISMMLGITEEILGTNLNERLKEYLSEKFCVGAFDSRSSCLIGVGVGYTGDKEEKSMNSDTSTIPVHVRQTDAVWKELLDGTKEERLGTKNIFHLYVSCVKYEYAGQGIAAEMCERMQKIAISQGCKKVSAIATSYYAQKVFKNFGFDFIKSIFYEEYIDPVTGNKIFNNMPKPHEKVVFVMKNL
ncbi:uncharacterized protein LOC120344435 [Styela clava]